MDQAELDKELVRNLTDMAMAGDGGNGAAIAQEQKIIALIADLRAKLAASERLITDAGLCIGSEFAGDLPRMVGWLIEKAKQPLPRRILEAEESLAMLAETAR